MTANLKPREAHPPPEDGEGRGVPTPPASREKSLLGSSDFIQCNESSVIGARSVSWWETYVFVDALVRQQGNTLPTAGTPEWCGLAEGDPRKLLALAAAGVHHVLRIEIAQQEQAAAAKAISAAADWSGIAGEVRRRHDFYGSKPWLKRRGAAA